MTNISLQKQTCFEKNVPLITYVMPMQTIHTILTYLKINLDSIQTQNNICMHIMHLFCNILVPLYFQVPDALNSFHALQQFPFRI